MPTILYLSTFKSSISASQGGNILTGDRGENTLTGEESGGCAKIHSKSSFFALTLGNK